MKLYEKLLGNEFNLMPEALRKALSSRYGFEAEGKFNVHHGKGINKLFAILGGFPSEGENVRTHLSVIPYGEKEIWLRTFNNKEFKSIMREQDMLLYEKFRFTTHIFRLEANDMGFKYIHIFSKFMGLKLPKSLSFKIEGEVEGTSSGWNVSISVHSPLTGLIVSYTGYVNV